jgi:putative DNA primase/helicase
MSAIDRVVSHFKNAKRNGDGWQAICPAHDDQKPSLSIRQGRDGRVLLKCMASCDTRAVVAAAGLEMADLFDEHTNGTSTNGNGNGTRPHVVAEYRYVDEAGAHLFDVVRYDPKKFLQRSASGEWKMDGVRRVPYRLPQLRAGVDAGRHVLVVEGEKDADALVGAGFVATCNPGGAGKWRAEYDEHFRDAHVAILPDNDAPGRAHARDVATHLFGVAADVRIVELPGVPVKGDVSDWLGAGGTAEQLKAIVRATPVLTSAPVATATGGTNDGASVARVEIVSIADVKARPVRWIWRDYLPLGKLVVFDGLPGQGKSTLALDIAARGSRGAGMPDGSPGLGTSWGTLILSYEDDAADTIRPRLEAAGADLTRIGHIVGVAYNGDPELLPPSLPKDVEAIDAELVARPDVRLLIIDPLMAALSADVDSHRDQDVRRPLARLARMAAERNVCVIIVRHVRKGHGGNAIYAGGGSVGISGQARVVLIVEQHPDDASLAVLAVAKANMSAIPPARAFRKVLATVPTDAGELIHTSRLEWTGETNLTADELLAARGDGGPSEGKDAADWLRDVLQPGRMERESAGFSERTLDRVAKRLGIQRTRDGFGADMRAYWTLSAPSSSATSPQFRQVPPLSELGGTDENGGTGVEQRPPRDDAVFDGYAFATPPTPGPNLHGQSAQNARTMRVVV